MTKVSSAPLLRGVGLQVRLLKAVDDRAAQLQRVADVFHHVGMLRHPGHAAEIDHAAEGDHQVLKAEPQAGVKSPASRSTQRLGTVDRADLAAQRGDVFAESPDRIDHVARVQRRAGDLRQHGLEDHEVFLGQDRDSLRAFVAKCPPQRLRAVDAGEAAAGDQHVIPQFFTGEWRLGHAAQRSTDTAGASSAKALDGSFGSGVALSPRRSGAWRGYFFFALVRDLVLAFAVRRLGDFVLRAVRAALRKASAVGAPFSPGRRIFSPLPCSIRSRLRWILA